MKSKKAHPPVHYALPHVCHRQFCNSVKLAMEIYGEWMQVHDIKGANHPVASITINIEKERCDYVCITLWYRSSSADTAEMENGFYTLLVVHELSEPQQWHVSCTCNHFQMLQMMVWLFDSTKINFPMERLPVHKKVCISFLFCTFL